MHATQNEKRKISHRLKIAKGHLEKVIEMVSDDTYCIDVIHQLQAVQSALQHTSAALLESHLKTCVINQIKDGNTDESIAEIMKVFKKTNGEFS